MNRARRTADEGFTLIELLATMILFGVLAAIGVGAIGHWRDTSEHQGSAREVLSRLRNAAERSVGEGRTYCVDLAGSRTYTLWRYSCGGATGIQVDGILRTQSAHVSFSAAVTLPTPPPACPSGDSCVYFYPRGTATPATITVRSSVRSTTYTIRVEGLTARVYM